MGYRPEPKLGPAPIVFLLIVLSVGFGIGYFEDTQPHNEHIEKETKKILRTAHQEAVNSVDTLDLQWLFADTESAKKDSAHLAKEMLKWMKRQGENPRFCDYKYVYDTINKGNGQKGFRLSKYMWRINTSKAMKDPDFAQTYKKYRETIKQLEIARRQNKCHNK